MKFGLLATAALLPLSMIATAAEAQDAAPASQPQAVETAAADEESTGPWEIDAEVGVHTDYRFRGISLSGKDPEVTGELSVSHKSGFYGVAWVSNVDLDDGKADEAELDLSAGWSGDAGPINFDVGGVYYLYPGNGDFNYFELYASAGYSIGEGEVRVGAAFAPSQDNIGNTSNRYYYVSGEMPIKDSPVTLHASFGLEDGAFADKKRDWLVGADVDLGKGFTATLDYVDTARAFTPLGKATFVGRLTFGF
ncbi:TorF family putative porin [Sphingomonas jaspsi]|uniref:TorF family putative porin n=1 Tax=Sphingomonas jaspsi TaxID=392409 RepID=UPI0004B5A094|nr:TorF family putative porin [Sphingomonas jaspsi]